MINFSNKDKFVTDFDWYKPLIVPIGFEPVSLADIFGHVLFIKASRKKFRRNK